MDETTTVETTTALSKEDAVPKKKTTKPKSAPPKAAKKAKAPKGTKPKREKAPKEPLPGRVFAIRVTDAELEAIHKAAGPRNATRFIRAVAAAFAAEDEAAFRAVVEQAREARG